MLEMRPTQCELHDFQWAHVMHIIYFQVLSCYPQHSELLSNASIVGFNIRRGTVLLAVQEYDPFLIPFLHVFLPEKGLFQGVPHRESLISYCQIL
jgi:hypothetical protein